MGVPAGAGGNAAAVGPAAVTVFQGGNLTDLNSDGATHVAAVEELMALVVKAHRAINLYMPNNPVYQETVSNLAEGFKRVWADEQQLVLNITDQGIGWEDEIVLPEEKTQDSISWTLFKDGIRTLTLTPGAEDEEIVQFLGLVHQVRTLPADSDDDLLTLLWTQDFHYIAYQAVDLGAAENTKPIPPPSQSEAARSPDQVRQEVQEDVADKPEGIVSVDDFDSTLYFLDDDEVAYLNGEIQREYSQDLRRNVLSMLFDILEVQDNPPGDGEIIAILHELIPYLLGAGDFRSVAYLLGESRVILERVPQLALEHREALAQFPASMSRSDTLNQLLQTLDEAEEQPADEDLSALFGELTPDAIETVLSWLPRLKNATAKDVLTRAVGRLAPSNPEAVGHALGSSENTVVLGALQLITQLKLESVASQLGQVTNHEDDAIRAQVAAALAALATPSALMQLEKMVDDPARDVRLAAVRTLGEHRYRGAATVIETLVFGKVMKTADLGEKRVFFETFGLIADNGGVDKLGSILVGKGMLSRKEDPQTRACAAMALGKIGSAQAKEILQNIKKEKEPLVKNAVDKALKEIR
ncbi:MAG: HEAT repeat domain-containing protein [Gemmatimonadetes bacterium]|nr:HEAT repeat domain-containing protein [Gemmatimonadota bacterium]